jgi:hypothetical protein
VSPSSSAPLLQATRVTTTDLLKVIGVATFLVDHYGFFFHTDELWWRMFGRVASPIFFFLIGFARTREVPWTWLVFGLVLSASQAWTMELYNLNILLNFALLRFAVLPLVERFVMPRPWAIALLAFACIPLIVPTDRYLEYGTEGWLWALFGLARRMHLEGRQPAWSPYGLGAVAAAAYLHTEIVKFGFSTVQTTVLLALILSLTAVLARFRREPLPWQPAPAVASLFQLCGRHSLEIYAITLFGMQVVAYAMRP